MHDSARYECNRCVVMDQRSYTGRIYTWRRGTTTTAEIDKKIKKFKRNQDIYMKYKKIEQRKKKEGTGKELLAHFINTIPDMKLK